MEIAPEQFDVPYFFSVNASTGLGEKFFFAGLMNDSFLVSFRKVGTSVQLIALNTRYFAQPKTPQALGVREAFSDSMLANAPIVSQPHAERKSVLIEMNTLLLSDIPARTATSSARIGSPIRSTRAIRASPRRARRRN
jgi:hypothetical protein